MLLTAIINSIEYLLKIVPFIILGVVLAELLVSLGWFDKFDFLVQPITNFGHLKKNVEFLSLRLLPPHLQPMLHLKACTTGG